MSRDFSFKQFSVRQQRAAFKVGTDSVVLGAWAHIAPARHILDLGTGTGLLALQCAQRNPQALIHAIDKDGDSAQEAAHNFAVSPWPHRLRAECLPMENLPAEARYDYIISNPPYFLQALLPADVRKADARHAHGDWFILLAGQVNRCSVPEGVFGCVVPTEAFESLNGAFTGYHWHLRRVQRLLPYPGGQKIRLLAEWHRADLPTLHLPDLYVRDAQGQYDDAYKGLTADFYLKF